MLDLVSRRRPRTAGPSAEAFLAARRAVVPIPPVDRSAMPPVEELLAAG